MIKKPQDFPILAAAGIKVVDRPSAGTYGQPGYREAGDVWTQMLTHSELHKPGLVWSDYTQKQVERIMEINPEDLPRLALKYDPSEDFGSVLYSVRPLWKILIRARLAE